MRGTGFRGFLDSRDLLEEAGGTEGARRQSANMNVIQRHCRLTAGGPTIKCIENSCRCRPGTANGCRNLPAEALEGAGLVGIQHTW